MRATLLVRTRIIYSTKSFAELVLWELPIPVSGSEHRFKYRLAYVVEARCVLHYDNETGKGDHRHYGGRESDYRFSGPQQLRADFERDIARWNRENRSS
jgi:hypothetical protein